MEIRILPPFLSFYRDSNSLYVCLHSKICRLPPFAFPLFPKRKEGGIGEMKIPWGKREKGNSRLMSFNPERFALIILGGFFSRSLADLFDFWQKEKCAVSSLCTTEVLNNT